MTDSAFRNLLEQYKIEITNCLPEIEETVGYRAKRLDRFTFTFGWALGKGLTIKEAHLLTMHIVYKVSL